MKPGHAVLLRQKIIKRRAPKCLETALLMNEETAMFAIVRKQYYEYISVNSVRVAFSRALDER